MKLRRLDVRRLPGVERPFVVDSPDPGLNVLLGPNGIGKSRLCAAVRALLWDEQDGMEGKLTASALFQHEGVDWHVERDGPHLSWQRDGQDSAPPPLPGERLAGCFFLGLAELLDTSDRAGRDLAGEVRLQMSGGFDLDAVQQALAAGVSARAGSKEARQLAEAEGRIRKAGAQQRQVEESERQLTSLERAAADARRALGRIAAIRTALQRAQWRQDHARHVAELSGLPEVLGQLDGKEADAWESLEAELAAIRAERAEAVQLIEDAAAAAERSGLEEPIGADLLAEWLERAEGLRAMEQRCHEARDRAGADRSRLVVALRALGCSADEGITTGSPTLEEAAELFAFLREAQQLEAKTVALRERLEVLAAHPFLESDQERLAALRRAVDPLRDWLRAPRVVQTGDAPAAEAWPARRLWLVIGVALALLGTTWLAVGDASAGPWLALGAGLGVLVAGLLTRVRSATAPGPDLQSVAREKYPAGLEPPSTWTPEAVSEHLASLEEELASLLSAQQVARYREADRAGIGVSLEGLAERGQALGEVRRELADRLGLGELRPDAELVDMARAVGDARRARMEARASAAAWEGADADRLHRLAEVGAFLVTHGESEAVDAAGACAAIRSLQARDAALARATETRQGAERRRERMDERIAQLEAAAADLFGRAGLEVGDRAGLTMLLAHRPRYLELVVARDQTLDRIRAAEQQLAEAGEAELSTWDTARLMEEQAALEVRSERASALDQQIGGIREKIRVARAGHELEDAMAGRDGALAELRDRRDEVLSAAAGDFLLTRVRHEHETHQMPRVLERARGRFATFTHHRYLLEVSAEEGGAFRAVDQRSGQGLGLDKLSDGTRAQLILAARLAFADEVEKGSELPLFLDEALDHSDPDRFHAIARCLARMVADEGRQIFYLSNDPTDGQRFSAAFLEEGCRPPRILDLAALLGVQARADGPGSLQVEALQAVPSPEDQTAASYGEALGVPPLEPAREASAQHVYYLLRDDLPLLHRLLELRLETVGPCRALLQAGTPTARRLLESSRTGEQLAARIDLLETYCLAWSEGRGKPVERADIEESEAVSSNYLEAVVRAAADLSGDARALLAELSTTKPRGEPLSGFRSSALEKLEQHFVERGHLDDRPVLTEDELLARLLITPAAQRLSAPVAGALVHEWWTLGQPSGRDRRST